MELKSIRKERLQIILSAICSFYAYFNTLVLLDIIPEFLTVTVLCWPVVYSPVSLHLRPWSLNSFIATGTLWSKYHLYFPNLTSQTSLGDSDNFQPEKYDPNFSHLNIQDSLQQGPVSPGTSGHLRMPVDPASG